MAAGTRACVGAAPSDWGLLGPAPQLESWLRIHVEPLKEAAVPREVALGGGAPGIFFDPETAGSR